MSANQASVKQDQVNEYLVNLGQQAKAASFILATLSAKQKNHLLQTDRKSVV